MSTTHRLQGPLTGVKIVEFAGIGPAPFCGMLLSDLGADVIRIDRPGAQGMIPIDITARGRRSIALNLKLPEAKAAVMRLIGESDGLVEGYRPGVMERLGLGPEEILKAHPHIAYGRMTGWGQNGPLAQAAGHDLNYIALTGALNAIGTPERPIVPLNLIGDYGGGGVFLAFGMLAAVLHARSTGKGQVVDCAMVDGVTSLLSWFYSLKACNLLRPERGTNVLDGGAHYYNNYRCADGRWISIASVEPQFYAELLAKLDLKDPQFQDQKDQAAWGEMTDKLAALFATKAAADWCALMEGSDVCFAPILDYDEAVAHPHNVARQAHVEAYGVVQPAPAPRFSATPGAIAGAPPKAGEHNLEILQDWGFSAEDIANLQHSGAI